MSHRSHDPASRSSSQALTLLQRALRGVDQADANTPSHPSGSQPGPGQAFLREAALPPDLSLDVQLEVKQRNKEPPTPSQVQTILEYLRAEQQRAAESASSSSSSAGASTESPANANSISPSVQKSLDKIEAMRKSIAQKEAEAAAQETSFDMSASSDRQHPEDNHPAATGISSPITRRALPGATRSRVEQARREARGDDGKAGFDDKDDVSSATGFGDSVARPSYAVAPPPPPPSTTPWSERLDDSSLVSQLKDSDLLLVDWEGGRATTDLRGVQELLHIWKAEQEAYLRGERKPSDSDGSLCLVM